MTKPITPDEVGKTKESRIPAQVIDAFNELITENWGGRSATFTQDKVVERILIKMPGVARSDVFERRWLDVENLFRRAGWTVAYDKPGYCETYEATFMFTRRRTS